MTRYLAWLVVASTAAVVGWSVAGVFDGEPCCGDITFHYAEVVRLAEAMRAGDWDWWNAGGNSGFASGYYYQVVPQAAPAALSAVTGLPALTAFQLGVVVPLLLVPASAYRAVRVVRGTPWEAAGAAIAVPFAIGGSRWGHGGDGMFLIGLYTQAWALAAFPLALAHATRWCDAGAGLASALAWGLFVGLCHPFAGVALGLALAAYSVLLAVRSRAVQPLQRVATLGALLVAGSACAWLPIAVDYDGFGGFPRRPADEVGPGFVELARWIASGELLDHGRSLPLLTIAAAAVACCVRAPWAPCLWSAAAIYALLLGVGPNLPTVGDDLLPPVRFIGPLQIVLALAAGAGVARACGEIASGERRPIVHRLATVGAAGLAAALAATGARTQRDRVVVASQEEGLARDQLEVVMQAMRAAPPGRFQASDSVINHWTAMLPSVDTGRGATVTMGGAALQSSPNYAYHWQLQGEPARVAWVFDAPLLLTRPGEVREGRLVMATAGYELRWLAAPGLVSPVQVVGGVPAGRDATRASVTRWLWSAMPARGEVLAHHGYPAKGPAPRGRVRAIGRGGSTIRADVEADAPTTFIVRETWHPRWRATLDGAPVPIGRVTPDYLAVDVGAGLHRLELRFERPIWTWLLWLLWPGVVVAARAIDVHDAKALPVAPAPEALAA
jgi:hypothetical protein